jgi:hypothetical protein
MSYPDSYFFHFVPWFLNKEIGLNGTVYQILTWIYI